MTNFFVDVNNINYFIMLKKIKLIDFKLQLTVV